MAFVLCTFAKYSGLGTHTRRAISRLRDGAERRDVKTLPEVYEIWAMKENGNRTARVAIEGSMTVRPASTRCWQARADHF